MRAMVAKYPDDVDAATLFAESLMMLRPWQLWSLEGEPAPGTLELVAVLGKANMQVSDMLNLAKGTVIELDRKVGEAIDIYVNNRLVARGEVVVVEERLGVTMTEIIKTDRG